jgi:hypothetical protein
MHTFEKPTIPLAVLDFREPKFSVLPVQFREMENAYCKTCPVGRVKAEE